jgi:hypothetical protein
MTQETVSTFVGYRHLSSPGDGAFYDGVNMSSDKYPAAAVRQPRRKVTMLAAPGGVCAKEKLAWVDGTQLYYDGVPVAAVTSGEKRFVSLGARLLVWPDKICYNTADGTVQALEAHYESTGDVTYKLCASDGTPYEGYYVGDTMPDETVYTYWMDTSATPNVMRVYTGATGVWNSVPTTYVKIGAAGIGSNFAAGDGVTLEGCAVESLNGAAVLQDVGDDYVVVTGLLEQETTQTAAKGTVSMVRSVPDLDYLAEHENRVWGVARGVNEIYACKLGDATNWNCFAGLASDSYTASVGSDGVFTGASAHLGYVLLFKENCIHKVYGTKPSNFQITRVDCRGVQDGCADSLCLVNEVLYYKSRTDVCGWDGSLPTGVSDALGATMYGGAVAGSLGERYYISMRDTAGEYVLFCYDTSRGIWCKEDDFVALGFAQCSGALYGLAQDGVLWEMCPENTTGDSDAPVPFRLVTGALGVADMDAKYYHKLQLRVSVPQGGSLRLAVAYDESGVWEELCHLGATGMRAVTVPVVLRRCDSVRLKLWGKGGMVLYGMAKVKEGGGESAWQVCKV